MSSVVGCRCTFEFCWHRLHLIISMAWASIVVAESCKTRTCFPSGSCKFLHELLIEHSLSLRVASTSAMARKKISCTMSLWWTYRERCCIFEASPRLAGRIPSRRYWASGLMQHGSMSSCNIDVDSLMLGSTTKKTCTCRLCSVDVASLDRASARMFFALGICWMSKLWRAWVKSFTL